MHPGLVRVIAYGVVFGGWAATAIAGYLRGLKKLGTFEYECPRCHNGNVIARNYGSADQFETGECTTCEYKYDGLTEDYIQ